MHRREHQIPLNLPWIDLSGIEAAPAVVGVWAATAALWTEHGGEVPDSWNPSEIDAVVADYCGIDQAGYPWSLADIVRAIWQITPSTINQASHEPPEAPPEEADPDPTPDLVFPPGRPIAIPASWWSLKLALAGGRAVLASVRIPPIWADQAARGIHEQITSVNPCEWTDATVIMIYGWNDDREMYLFQYLDEPSPRDRDTGMIAYNWVGGLSQPIETIVLL